MSFYEKDSNKLSINYPKANKLNKFNKFGIILLIVVSFILVLGWNLGRGDAIDLYLIQASISKVVFIALLIILLIYEVKSIIGILAIYLFADLYRTIGVYLFFYSVDRTNEAHNLFRYIDNLTSPISYAPPVFFKIIEGNSEFAFGATVIFILIVGCFFYYCWRQMGQTKIS